MYIFTEYPKLTESDRTMKAVLGGKGANLAEMANAGLPFLRV